MYVPYKERKEKEELAIIVKRDREIEQLKAQINAQQKKIQYSVLQKYRCELRYSSPEADCDWSSKNFGGLNAISTADISLSDYNNGAWRKYSYWAERNYIR
jgi:hypothetical protein